MLQKIRSQIILTILISIVALTCKGYAEVSLDILKPTENEKISLPSVSVKGKVTPPEKLVGKIKWETTVEGNKSIQETDSEQEGAIVVAPFPIHNSSFGPNTVIAKAKIEVGTKNPDLLIESLKNKYSKENINVDDGLRIDFTDHWVHFRKSNTEPIIRCIVEAKTKKAAQEFIKKYFSELS